MFKFLKILWLELVHDYLQGEKQRLRKLLTPEELAQADRIIAEKHRKMDREGKNLQRRK